jgi:hypothetical protein
VLMEFISFKPSSPIKESYLNTAITWRRKPTRDDKTDIVAPDLSHCVSSCLSQRLVLCHLAWRFKERDARFLNRLGGISFPYQKDAMMNSMMQLRSMMIWLSQVIGRGRRFWKLVTNDLRRDLGSILKQLTKQKGSGFLMRLTELLHAWTAKVLLRTTIHCMDVQLLLGCGRCLDWNAVHGTNQFALQHKRGPVR